MVDSRVAQLGRSLLTRLFSRTLACEFMALGFNAAVSNVSAMLVISMFWTSVRLRLRQVALGLRKNFARLRVEQCVC